MTNKDVTGAIVKAFQQVLDRKLPIDYIQVGTELPLWTPVKIREAITDYCILFGVRVERDPTLKPPDFLRCVTAKPYAVLTVTIHETPEGTLALRIEEPSPATSTHPEFTDSWLGVVASPHAISQPGTAPIHVGTPPPNSRGMARKDPARDQSP